jgi:hypothetical protein
MGQEYEEVIQVSIEHIIDQFEKGLIHWSELRSSKYWNAVSMVCAICKIAKQRKRKIYNAIDKINEKI